MVPRPLLSLPTPSRVTPPTAAGGGSKRSVRSIASQQHIPTQFAELQRALLQRSVELGQNVLGIEPDQVLVLETDHPIEDFQRAIQRIAGLEWLAEELGVDIDDEEETEKEDVEQSLPRQAGLFEQQPPAIVEKPKQVGHFYVTFSSQAALNQLFSLWKQYEADQNTKFAEGLAPLQEVFRHLMNIRPWGVVDRLRETGLLLDWQERLNANAELVPVEIELWFRQVPAERQRRASLVRQLISVEDGIFIGERVIDEIRYHSILAKVSASAAQRIISYNYTQLVRCEEIMLLRAVGQVIAPIPSIENPDIEHDSSLPPSGVATTEQPLVALLDGLPLENHVHLSGRLSIDDPDGWEDEYEARERRHGTAMASLILHGELDAAEEPLRTRLYVRPLLKPNLRHQIRLEQIPEEVLTVDLVYRALLRMFEGEAAQPAVAPSVVIINLSVGDRDRPFLGRMLSPWARLLDWAAWKYKVLFCVSAGNHTSGIEVRMASDLFRNLPPPDRERQVLQSISEDHRNRRLLSPAEAINALTVGAAHADRSQPRPNERRLDVVATSSLVSPVSAQGPGFRQSVKPDFLHSGGRVVFDEVFAANPTVLRISNQTIPPGHRVAVPGMQPGQLDRIGHLRGTSNATALTSRAAAQCLELLDELASQWGRERPERKYLPAILKTMLAHGASWDDGARRAVDGAHPEADRKALRNLMARLFGYGVLDVSRLKECTEQRATLIGWGELAHQDVLEYRLPIPPSLAGQRVRRRLTVTLGWLSPLNFSNRRYRSSKLWFAAKADSLNVQRRDATHHAVRRGTLQHEVFEGTKVTNFVEGDDIVLHVHCKEDAGGHKDPIPYGLCVTLEVEEGADIPIYEEVRARVSVPIRIRAGH